MKPILLISYPTDKIPQELNFAFEVNSSAKKDFLFKFEKSTNAFDADFWQKNSFATIVFDCHNLQQQELITMLRLTKIAPEIPLMVLANQISLQSYGCMDLLKDMVALQKPFDPSVFMTLLERVVTRQHFQSARTPRFITNQPANMLVIKTGLLIPTRMRNYSSGGAFLEYHGISLKVGDQIKLKLQYNETDVSNKVDNKGAFKKSLASNKEQYPAKVVWIREGEGLNDRSPARGVGVQFLSSG